MLRIPALQVLSPTSWDEAAQLLSRHPEARVLAGGTDMLPALKTGQVKTPTLISVSRLPGFSGIELTTGGLRIAAGTPLADLARSPLVPTALAVAAGLVAGPQIRRTATLGGNLCLDTRCRYVNQSPLYRQSLGGCLKSHGDTCHVVAGGTSCVAALSADTVPVLVALEAELDLVGPAGARGLALSELYNSDGRQHLSLRPGELLRSVRLPRLEASTRVVYRKWRPRHSLDFPLVSLALRLDLDPPCVRDGQLVVGVLGPRPRVLPLTRLAGRPLDRELAEEIGRLAGSCRPLANVPYDEAYRRQRLEVEARRAALEIERLS